MVGWISLLVPLLFVAQCGSYSRIVISGGETVVVQIAVLRVASGNPWLARTPNPAEPRLADARRWAALAAHGLDRLAAASRHLAGTSGYLWIGGAVGIRSLNAVIPFKSSNYLGQVPALLSNGTVNRRASASDSGPNCDNECGAFDADGVTCNNTVVNDALKCYNCFVQIGTVTQQGAQVVIDGFVFGCDELGHTVNNATVTATGIAPTGSIGSTSDPATPASTSAPPTATNSAKSPAVPTKSATNSSASPSANVSPAISVPVGGPKTSSAAAPPGASGAAANMGGGVGLAAKSAVVMSTVLVVISAIITIG
ncbi:hypothetical protein C8R44DRAFT_785735 [Mycena epipterygia]|nr:hypothetical protein C8R44DRAFT_785735 [Mycena epipterygia]